MNKYEHLNLPVYQGEIKRKKGGAPGSIELPLGRSKRDFAKDGISKADKLISVFAEKKTSIYDKINPSLIYEIEMSKKASPATFENTLSGMGIHILSVAENKEGFWVVFNDDEELTSFKHKLSTYGSDDGPKYDFFNAIKTFGDISIDKKIGRGLKETPLNNETSDYIDIELWKQVDKKKNEDFIQELKKKYTSQDFRITDTLITKSIVLLRLFCTFRQLH